MHTRLHARTHTHTHTYTRARTHTCTHACTHAHKHTRARTHALTLARTHARTHTHTPMHAHTHAHTLARTHARTRAHTHTHTHTQTPSTGLDILPSTTAVFSYAIGSRKPSANEQFFGDAQTGLRWLQTNQIISDVCFITDYVVYANSNKTKIVWIETELLLFNPGGCVSCLRACLGARLLLQPYQYPNLSEGADRVGGQLRGDKECPFSGVTNSGRVWISYATEGALWRCLFGLKKAFDLVDQSILLSKLSVSVFKQFELIVFFLFIS